MTWTLLLSLLVKSSLIAGAGLICARVLSRRPAERADILRGVVCLLLTLPILMAVLPTLTLALLPAAPAPTAVLPMWRGEVGPVAGLEVSASLPWPTAATAVGLMWLLGVAMLAGRLLLGLHTLNRWTRGGRAVKCAAWSAPLDVLSPSTRPRLVASDHLSSPLSWGVSPGVILVDPASLAERQAAPAILAHELAHLRRNDWLFLILSRLALALFWFNPLVWRLHAELVARSEEAADESALQTVDRRLYARTLVRLASQPAPYAATAMAADARTLKTRIACIMSDTNTRRRPLTIALSVVALAAVATPLAALELSRKSAETPVVAETMREATPEGAVRVLTGQTAETTPPRLIPVSMKTPPAPPAPPAPPPAPPPVLSWSSSTLVPAPPAPPSPPARPAPPSRSVSYTYTVNGSPEDEQMAEEARQIAADVRARAADARQQAVEARRQAVEARRQAGDARRAGERAQQQARQAERRGGADLARGAEQMRAGAAQMRTESVRLQDPNYRARQIAENRARGNTVTDAELRALSASLPARADEMLRRADDLERQAARMAGR